MCHFGCWSHGWKSIKHSLLHQKRRRWRKMMSALPGLVSGAHYLTGRDKCNWCLSRKYPGHPSKARMPTALCWGGGGKEPLCQQGAGLGGVLSLYDAPLEPHHHGSQRCRMKILSLQAFPFLDSSWARGSHRNILCVTLVNRSLAVTLPNG